MTPNGRKLIRIGLGMWYPTAIFFILAIFFLRLVLRHLFSTSVGVLTSATIVGTTKYVSMGFKVLLLTIYSKTGALSESDE